MLVNVVDGLEVLSIKEAQSAQVRVSVAQVVVMVLHSSAKLTFVTLVRVVVGFETFVIIFNGMISVPYLIYCAHLWSVQ